MTWRIVAACRRMDPEVFAAYELDDDGTIAANDPTEAKQVCATCTVRPQCLADGRRDRWTIRGGLTPTERGVRVTITTPLVARPYRVDELARSIGRPLTITRLSRWARVNASEARLASQHGLTWRQATNIAETIANATAPGDNSLPSLAYTVRQAIGTPTLRTLWPSVDPDDVRLPKRTKKAKREPETNADPFAWVQPLAVAHRARLEARLAAIVTTLRQTTRSAA
jgi:hypothetical protein